MKKPTLTHLDSKGRAKMVNVGQKPITAREAHAEGFIILQRSTLEAIANDEVPKGEVFGTARLAGIMAAKKCGELIPLCHPLPIESVEVTFDIPELEPSSDEPLRIHIRAIARITGKTGVEMEALTAVSVAALTIYDMCKAIDKTMVIDGVRLVKKTGGTKGLDKYVNT
jgi:cyclic pyranopterin monophosphate synthase